MARWTCPNCEREFGGRNQAHVCSPGISVDELLSRHPDWVGEIYEAVMEPLRTLGPVHEDAVDVGVFLKSDRKLAEFRPRVRSVLLHVALPTPRDDPRVMRIYTTAPDRHFHAIKLTSPADVDDQMRTWLAEAYDLNTD